MKQQVCGVRGAKAGEARFCSGFSGLQVLWTWFEGSWNRIFCSELDKTYGKLLENDVISNLTLLDAGTNRSYRNAFFEEKRRKIIARDRGAVFVPVCTKNVFLKLYSDDVTDMTFWGEKDREDYLSAMREVLKDYIQEETSEKEISNG